MKRKLALALLVGVAIAVAWMFLLRAPEGEPAGAARESVAVEERAVIRTDPPFDLPSAREAPAVVTEATPSAAAADPDASRLVVRVVDEHGVAVPDREVA